MILKKTNKSIVCDMGGCSNKASYFICKKQGQTEYFSLKLCAECAKELAVAINKQLKKEKGVEDKQ